MLLKTASLALVSPENRARFRAQCQVRHGIYLDAHANPPTSPWYIDPLGGPRAARLEANVAAALRAADEYVWVYGETGRWWPSGNPTHPFWPEKIPGADRALLRAKDPIAAARLCLSNTKPEGNLLRNAGFDDGAEGGPPKEWWFWQHDASRGRPSRDAQVGAAAAGSARAAGAANGCFGQGVKVRAGEWWAVSVQSKRQGRGFAGVTVRWKDAAGKWTAQARDVQIAPAGPAGGQGWREHLGAVRVPDSASELILLLAVRGQVYADDAAWFDDARLIKMD